MPEESKKYRFNVELDAAERGMLATAKELAGTKSNRTFLVDVLKKLTGGVSRPKAAPPAGGRKKAAKKREVKPAATGKKKVAGKKTGKKKSVKKIPSFGGRK